MEIADGVHQVDGTRMANIFLLVGDRLALVDAGGRGSTPAILRYVQGLGRSLEELDVVVLTHYHSDHAGGLPQILRIKKAQVAAHEADVPYLEGRVTPPSPNSQGIAGAVLKVARPLFRLVQVHVDIMVQDGTELPVLGGLQVIHTPGHTPGSICLYSPSRRLLLVGDALNNRGGHLQLPPLVFTVDPQRAVLSVQKLAPLAVEVIGFGHGPAITSRAGVVLKDFLSAGPTPGD